MDKKDIYEHLAKIYLDASSKRKTNKPHQRLIKHPVFIGIASILLVGLFFSGIFRRNEPSNSNVALFLSHEPIKINFTFRPAKKEVYTLELNKLNMLKFKALAFSVRKVKYNDNIALRVEFTNSFKETSEVYFRDIPYKWGDYKINLIDFKDISDWSEIISLAFTVEEWNTKDKRGVVYIDNVRLYN